MTEQEAAEVILKGWDYIECGKCDGTGLAIVGARRMWCVSCGSCGRVSSYRYLEACKVLGLDAPEKRGIVEVSVDGTGSS